jgi:hypothetical protein
LGERAFPKPLKILDWERFTFAPYEARPHWRGLLDVRYAPIATKFCIATKCRVGPLGDISPSRISPNQGLIQVSTDTEKQLVRFAA